LRKKEYLIFKEYNEPGKSAFGDGGNREKFHEMIRDAKEGYFQTVLN